MEHGVDVGAHELRLDGRSLGGIGEQQVVHMAIVAAFRRNNRPAQGAAALQAVKGVVIALPQRQALIGDPFSGLELREEKGRIDLAGQIGRADVDPGVLVDRAAQEFFPVRPLLPQDLGPLRPAHVVDQQGAAFPGGHVLCFMKAHGAERAEAPQRTPAVAGEESLRRILDHQQPVTAGNVEDRIHLAADAGVMHRHDRPGARRDRRFDQRFVEVGGIGADVDKYRGGAAEDERIGRRDERERRHDDFVAGADLGEQGRHLERRRAGMGEQHLLDAQPLCQPGVTAGGKRTVAGEVPIRDRLTDVIKLAAVDERNVERNMRHVHAPGRRATTSSELPIGSDTPARIIHRSRSSTFSQTLLATRPILSSAVGSKAAVS